MYNIILNSLLHLRHTVCKTSGWSAESVFQKNDELRVGIRRVTGKKTMSYES